jgi:hypothetical protein
MQRAEGASLRELNANANSFTDTLKRLSTARRESKAAAEEVEKLLGKFKTHNKEYTMHSSQFDLVVRQAGDARSELAAAKRDVELGAPFRNFQFVFQALLDSHFYNDSNANELCLRARGATRRTRRGRLAACKARRAGHARGARVCD